MSDDDREPPPRPVVVGVPAGGTGPDGLKEALLAWARGLPDEARAWAHDRSWAVRVPVLLFFAYVLFRHMTQIEYGSFLMNGINLGFHEAGHILFRPLGEFMTIAGGTILQCLVPVVAAGYLYKKQGDFFGVAFCLCWLSTNCFNCAIYASDALGQLNLPLVSPWGQGFGADGIGDWSRMLSKLGLLESYRTIAFLWKAAGLVSMLAGLGLGGWLCWQMHAQSGRRLVA